MIGSNISIHYTITDTTLTKVLASKPAKVYNRALNIYVSDGRLNHADPIEK